MFWMKEIEEGHYIFLCPVNNMFLCFGLDTVVKYVFFKREINRKVMFMLDNLKIGTLVMHLLLIVFFLLLFTLHKKQVLAMKSKPSQRTIKFAKSLIKTKWHTTHS